MVQSKPSESWGGLDSLNSTSGQLYEQIRHVLDSADLPHLERLALAARRRADAHLDQTVACSIDPSVFSYGFNSVVFEVAFSDGAYWVAKVRHAPLDDDDDDNDDVVYALSEIATMRLVRERTTIPVPRVFGHQMRPSGGKGEFGFPFILMEFMPGRDVGGPLARDVPVEFLPKVAGQLADVLSQLESRLSFPSMGILWCGDDCEAPPEIIPLPSKDYNDSLDNSSSPQTSLEWFYNQRQEENKEVIQNHPDDPEWNTACWVLKDALSHIITGDRVRGPFPLCHMDFHHGNLLFDEEFNLTGIIDWGMAQTVPLERLAVSPEFVAGQFFPQEHKDGVARLLGFMRESLRDMQQDSRSGGATDGHDRANPKRRCGRDADEEVEEDDAGGDGAGLHGAEQTTLADIFGTVQAEIANRCALSNPRVALPYGRAVQELVYGQHVSWEQMVLAFGEKKLH